MYLLSTQSLVDIMRGTGTPVGMWHGSLTPDIQRHVFVSVLSFGRIASQIHDLPAASRGDWTKSLARTRHLMLRDTRVLGIDMDLMDLWADLLVTDLSQFDESGEEIPLADDDRLIVATAILRRFILIDRPQPFHATVKDRHRLEILNPG